MIIKYTKSNIEGRGLCQVAGLGVVLFRIAWIVLAALLLQTCGERTNSPVVASQDNLTYALQTAVTSRVVVAVKNFYQQTEMLQTRAEGFCITATESELIQLQQQWINTNQAWFRLANYQLGPLKDDLVFPPFTFIDSLRLRGTEYIATVRAEVGKDINGNFALDESYYKSKTFQRVGLLAIEVALFETADQQQSAVIADITAEYQQAPRKCEMLMNLVSLLSSRAQSVQSGWLTSFKGRSASFQTLFIADELEDGTPALTALLTSVQEQLDYLRSRNVVNTAAPLANSAWQALGGSIMEISQLLEGQENQPINFFSIMANASYSAYVDEVRENIRFALTAINEQNKPNLDMALSQLDGNFKRQIPEGLDVDLGINFTDGD